jgi:hypothetical protein
VCFFCSCRLSERRFSRKKIVLLRPDGRFHGPRPDFAGATEPKNYNDHVARGWESKSVEAQQAEAAEKSSQPRPKMSAEEAAVFREKENLRLARQQVLQRLEASQNPRHRKLMEDALADLDEKLGRLAK